MHGFSISFQWVNISITIKFIIVRTVRDNMNITRLCSCFCLIIAVVLLPLSATGDDTYTSQTIDDLFIVKLPDGWSNFAVNTYTGMAAGVMNNSDIANVISIQVYQNMDCSMINRENLKVNLDEFNAKAGIAALSEPVYGNDTITQYGKFYDGKTSHLFLRLFEGDVVAVFGSYGNMEDAKTKSEEFITIATSVTPLHPSTNELCQADNQEPSPATTVNNTTIRSETPVS
ncbi:MAG: hypothetical protein BWX96_03244 [Bacteroidetes bacterium ADurb.Bin145]|nr:MAG: hypothetical protein BWX96_03244 [Bacteroidetes bacterium ADurb.Bin145]